MRAGPPRRCDSGFHPLSGRLSDTRSARWRKVGHDWKPDSESVHYRARLAVWLGCLARVDGGGDAAACRLRPPRRRGPVVKRPGLALSIYALAAFLFLHLPLLILAAFSFNSSRFTVWEGFSLRWYAGALQDSQLMEASWNSLIIAISATIASTIIGTLCA